MKVSELSNDLLDYWVAHIEGIDHPLAMQKMAPGFVMVPYESKDDEGPITRYRAFQPTSSWADGGPIIEREHIGIGPATRIGGGWAAIVASADHDAVHTIYADTPLVAAMRAYVASKFGDDIPEEVIV